MIIHLFLGLITWQSILIINSNNLKTDENLLIKNIKDEIKEMKVSLKNFDEKRSLTPEDIEKLKMFQTGQRIFWGPKLEALIHSVSEDMVITKMELINRKFKMVVYTRFDSLNPSNTAYRKGKKFEEKLTNSEFIKYFKTDEQGEPNFTAVKYEDDIIKSGNVKNKVHKIVFEGELEKTLQKKSRIKRKNNKKKDK